MPLLECVPNVSEGRDRKAIQRFADAAAAVQGVDLLDIHSDPTHHRSVFTMVGDAGPLQLAVMALFRAVMADVDLGRHQGAHPRIGAVDVVPFVPLRASSMDDAVRAARATGAAVAAEFGVPVFLYGAAASRPERRALEHVRRGQFEGLAEKLQHPDWQPDFGPATRHPRAGAAAIGARGLLVAYNINLATDRLDVATRVARAVRESSGGLVAVKAMGLRLPDRGIVQVSMNLTDTDRTSMDAVFTAVTREAAVFGVDVLESEIVGLVPMRALIGPAAQHLRVPGLALDRVLESRLPR